jgi:hypothetical protein
MQQRKENYGIQWEGILSGVIRRLRREECEIIF